MTNWLRDISPALAVAAAFVCLIDYRLHPIAWIIPAVMLVGTIWKIGE